MSNKWLNGSDSGILRKTNKSHVPVNTENLLVFGYACKLFRDDDKAKFIDQGKHLIPWMGTDQLKIDRYDVRATLSDITPYEPPAGGYTNRLEYLTVAEQRAEQLCEEERYFSLYNAEVSDEEHDQSLEQQQQQPLGSYCKIGYNYDGESTTEQLCQPDEQSQDSGKSDLFVPHPNFNIPDDIEMPTTIKQNLVIEKTAQFIAQQGIQMEILIKTKQSNNPQFEFLNQNDRLNKYYKYILSAIKAGSYPFEMTESSDTTLTDEHTTHSDDTQPDTIVVEPVLPPILYVPTLKYKPSADCTYTQLISKIKGVPIPDISIPSQSTESYLEPIQFHSNYLDQISLNSTQVSATVAASVVKETPFNARTDSKSILSKTLIDQESMGSLKQLSSGLLLAQYYHSGSESDEEPEPPPPPPPASQPSQPLSSASDTNDVPIKYKIPPAELQNIIDKTASYVLKNGKEFEDILRTKNDGRFSFLMPSDEYNSYYNHKIAQNVNPSSMVAVVIDSIEQQSSNDVQQELKMITNSTKSTASVSFSIRAKDEQPLRQHLLHEQSSDEEDSTISSNTKSNETVYITQQQQQPSQCRTNADITLQSNYNNCGNGIGVRYSDDNNSSGIKSTKKELDLSSDSTLRDAMLESVCQKDEEKRAAKRVEDRIKDRLAQAARSKLGSITREKQLQLERKKKAMAFLNQIKSNTNVENIRNDESNTLEKEKLSSPTKSQTLQTQDKVIVIASDKLTTPSPNVSRKQSDEYSDMYDGRPSTDDKSDQKTESKSRSMSRSKSRSSSQRRSKSKKSKHKKDSNRKSASPRRRSCSKNRNRSRSRSRNRDDKHKQRSYSLHKSKRKRRNSRDS